MTQNKILINKISINGELFEANQALISVDQRGFMFGDGIFETCLIWQGKILNQKWHWRRIESGLNLLDFPDCKQVLINTKEYCQKLIIANKTINGLLRISISRGIGSFGYIPTYNSESLIVIKTLKKRQLPEKIEIGVSEIIAPRPIGCLPTHKNKDKDFKNPSSSLQNIKSSNSISYILNKIQASKQNLFEMLMIDENGFVCDTSSANIFWIKNGQIFTPADELYLMHGCARQALFELFGDKILKVKAKFEELLEADEMFLTNSAHLVMPVDDLKYGSEGKNHIKIFGKTHGKEVYGELFNFLCKQAD